LLFQALVDSAGRGGVGVVGGLRSVGAGLSAGFAFGANGFVTGLRATGRSTRVAGFGSGRASIGPRTGFAGGAGAGAAFVLW
jgi:hypothetical protein